MSGSSWWQPYISSPSSVNKLTRPKLEELYNRSLDHLRQLSEKESEIYSSMRDLSAKSSQSMHQLSALGSPRGTQKSTLIVSSDKRVAQLCKTINSLNADREQLHEEIRILQEMLMKLNANINKDKFTPADLLYSYTFENPQMKKICECIVDLNNSTQDETDHEDYLFILDLFSENTLQLLQRRIDKTKPVYNQRINDYLDDIATLAAEKQLAQNRIQDLNNKIDSIPPPETVNYDDIESLIHQIDDLGDTAGRLAAARRKNDDLMAQKRLIAEDEPLLNMIPNIADKIDTIDVNELKDEKAREKDRNTALQQQNEDLMKRFQVLTERNSPKKAPTSARGRKGSKVNKSPTVPADMCTRLASLNVNPIDVQSVWNWSQSTRLEDLMNDINSLTEHKQLLTNRRDSLQRKIQQLNELLATLDQHIEEYNKVIQESKRAEEVAE